MRVSARMGRGESKRRRRKKWRESKKKKQDLNARKKGLFRHEHAVGFRINDLLTNVVYYYEL